VLRPRKDPYIIGPQVLVQPNQTAKAEALCPAGTKPVGGGYDANIGRAIGEVWSGTTPGGENGWAVVVSSTSSTLNFPIRAYAVCVAR
jgi:hypothetical protein